MAKTLIDTAALLSNSIVAIAAAITALCAVKGVSTWQREQRGKADFETARALAKATYHLRNEIKACRSPFLRFTGAQKLTGYERADAFAQIYTERFRFVRVALEGFDSATLEAEAIWGEKIREKTDSLRRCTQELWAAVEAYVANEQQLGSDFSADKAFGIRIRATVANSSEEDPLTIQINGAIQEIENELRPYLSRSKADGAQSHPATSSPGKRSWWQI